MRRDARGKSSPTPRVLIVDDNRAFGENLVEILSEAGYRAGFASSVAAATKAAGLGFDLALVDVRLPDGDGTALAGLLKSQNPESEIVMLTGFATLETATAAVRTGAFAYLLKPCAIDQLLLTLEQAMRQVRLQAEKRDLARRAQVAEKLAAVGTLTAGLSHEIRNPLNSAGLQLTVLERRIQGLPAELKPPLIEPLRLVHSEIRRLEHILQDFLQFARPLKLNTAPMSLDLLLARVLDLLEPDVDQRAVRIERQLTSVAASIDADRLHQVVLNLCLNGIQAMTSGGVLTVTTALEGREAVITIDDTGSGDSGRSPASPVRAVLHDEDFAGSGLGLPIAHAIVEQHGGTIGVRNRETGGARFEVRLPAAEG